MFAWMIAMRTRRPAVVQHRFVADELVTVLLQNGAREGLAAHHENRLIVLLQLVDQRHEIAVAADDGERVDVIVRERHLQRVERQIDIGAVLIAAWRGSRCTICTAYSESCAGGVLHPAPVRVGNLGDDFAPFLQGFENDAHVEFPLQRRFDADFDIVEVDEDRNLQMLFHFYLLWLSHLRVAHRSALRILIQCTAGVAEP